MISCNGETTESGKKYKYLHNILFSENWIPFFQKKKKKKKNTVNLGILTVNMYHTALTENEPNCKWTPIVTWMCKNLIKNIKMEEKKKKTLYTRRKK